MKSLHTCSGLLLALLFSGCAKPHQATEPPPASVTVSLPSEEPVVDTLDLTGSLAASRTVDLVARVSGYLRTADFAEGTLVQAGQLLFLIEPEPYEQQLALAKAALLQAQAEYDRQRDLLKENATSTANMEKWLSQRDQAAAQVEIAKINLGYTRVVAPFTGRIGRRLVDPGNYVSPSMNSKLATLEQVTPIYVNFNLNERDALRIGEYRRQQGMEIKPQLGHVPILVGLQNQEGYPQVGTLDFIDVSLSASSGTIAMRGSLKNDPPVFAPGLFARVRIALGQPKPLLVVPNSALGNDQEGDFVLVVEANDVVARRGVVKGPLCSSGRAIRSGLAAKDRVVVNGQMKARPGAKVNAVKADAAPAPSGSTPAEPTPKPASESGPKAG